MVTAAAAITMRKSIITTIMSMRMVTAAAAITMRKSIITTIMNMKMVIAAAAITMRKSIITTIIMRMKTVIAPAAITTEKATTMRMRSSLPGARKLPASLLTSRSMPLWKLWIPASTALCFVPRASLQVLMAAGSTLTMSPKSIMCAPAALP